MSADQHERFQPLLAAHALGDGSLTDEERRDLIQHLSACPRCRMELEELRSVSEFLEPYKSPDAEPAPDPNLEDRVVAAVLDSGRDVRRRRTPERLLPFGAAAVVILALLAFGIFSLTSAEDGPPGLGETEPVAFTDAPGVTIEATVVAHTWGTEVDLEVSGLDAGEVYAVEIEDESGESVDAGTFVAIADEPVECSLNGAVLRQDARSILVLDGSGEQVMSADLAPAPDLASST